ncbi:Nicotinate catabolism cluster-specific transcription factor [Pseudocercospora fuligena]|uniref:Nicotinate catabolism cluster-specific transcription factor n=1 Tax=Pseudocercospora fuligena TaxID=685502 RepID=A0A8H6RDD9_9PEZI|nr:Nicotinate catabolism cluster-specific transcription factor [Pseudocercospora fuligena]
MSLSRAKQTLTPTSPGDRHPRPSESTSSAEEFDSSPPPKKQSLDTSDSKSWPWLHENLFMKNGEGSFGMPLHPPPTSGTSYRQNSISPLLNVVENLVAYAANTAFTPEDVTARKRYWEQVSLQLASIFYEPDSQPVEAYRTLHHLIELYLSKFHVLWPFLNHEQLDANHHHPVLFLTISSVGAMFGQALQREYGTLMHERLRRLLSASLYDLEGPEDGLVWLAQARVLTQVASLYFGQRQGFSYAQHLNAITIAQLRRMNCFQEFIPDAMSLLQPTTMLPETELDQWQQAETRRRIAFGILRSDVYTSVLLSTRPILTADEFKMTFPRSDELWLNEQNLDAEGRLWAQRTEDSRTLQMPFSDLVRIFLEPKETNPVLGPVGYELVLFGLQEAVWKYSQDPALFPRLTGQCLQGVDFANIEQDNRHVRLNGTVILPQTNGQRYRKMDALHSDRSRLLQALEAWTNAVDASIQRGDFLHHQDTLMSSTLLYHLSRLRLCAPLEDLHHISYRVADPRTIQTQVLRKVEAWRKSPYAPEAARQAWNVKTLIEEELKKPQQNQARFNFLAFCCLHHSAVVLWTVAASERSGPESPIQSTFLTSQSEIETFLQECPKMFTLLSPLGGNSFEAAAYRLARHTFPPQQADVPAG